jgi:DNA-binding transcriptional ArsR family regulator
MNEERALVALGALAHPTRFAAFRLLLRHEPEGLATGELAAAAGLGQSTFSTHLAVLAKAHLVRAERRGRHRIQRAQLDTLRALMSFIADDCCGGRPELCTPLVEDLVRINRASCG